MKLDIWNSDWSTILVLVGGLMAVIGAFMGEKKKTKFEQEMREQTERTLASVTGGNGYCLIRPTFFYGSDQWSLMLSNDGSLPIYDVQVRLEDLTGRTTWMQSAIDRHEPLRMVGPNDKFTQAISVGNVVPSSAILPLVQLPRFSASATSQRYLITIMARNGAVQEFLKFARVSGEWMFALKATRTKPDRTVEILEESIPHDFPRKANGEVEW